MLADTGDRIAAWALRREYRSTYRDSLVGSERLVAGALVDTRAAGSDGRNGYRISVESGLAEELGVGVGDEIVWDVQGSRSRPGWRACARWTGRGSSPTSSWCSRPARWRVRRRRW